MIRRYKEIQATVEQETAKDSTMLKPVTVSGRKKLPEEDEALRASPFSDVIGPDQLHQGGVDMVYNALSNIPGLTSGINQTMSGTSAGISTGTSAMLVLVDGIQVNTGGDLKGFLETLDESNIEFIEVLKGPLTAIYGMQGSPGVVLIHSVNHSQNVVAVNDKGITTIYPKGYANQQDVFAATHEKKKGSAPAAATGDASTLYWNANLPTDNLGNAKVDFFTGSRQATLTAAIVGITPGGDILEKTIQIKCR
jgi:outer membrane receptor protein involved in Fe transport